ncbi:unnamed protein product [Lactuca virosa]|uniref:Uncharacterized protein n=1 Tax=Lactuca virosa TaxID=75947 RepID=A0AAU9MEH0_9ASTR|nr:unnamed protein product [Lactuca virosa]
MCCCYCLRGSIRPTPSDHLPPFTAPPFEFTSAENKRARQWNCHCMPPPPAVTLSFGFMEGVPPNLDADVSTSFEGKLDKSKLGSKSVNVSPRIFLLRCCEEIEPQSSDSVTDLTAYLSTTRLLTPSDHLDGCLII